jgi:SSS family solute:Na+ symporter
MRTLDWIVMLGTLLLITAYGSWKARKSATRESYMRGDNADRWWVVGLSVMATQLSAVTFLSTPGQGYLDGMRFVQFYFGLPLAMIVICTVFIPLYYKWNVFTAYEFIGKRFDGRMRLLTAFLFLVLRSLSAGITLSAPTIILSRVFGFGAAVTFTITGLVIIYTTIGGAKAVSATQTQQMAVIFFGMFAALGLLIHYLGEHMTFTESLRVAGAMGRMNVITTRFDMNDRYTLWSGLIGGFFLQLSYFGTDQSQVGRYLSGKSAREAKLGLVFTSLVKIPLQFTVLLTGVLVFVFYLFHASPVHWNQKNMDALAASTDAGQVKALEETHRANEQRISARASDLLAAVRADDPAAIDGARDELQAAMGSDSTTRAQVKGLITAHLPDNKARDDDHIFLTFILTHLPQGIIGLLLAVMLCASMGTASAELNALATTTTNDVISRKWSEKQQIRATRWATIAYGGFAMSFAGIASMLGNLIQAVNIVGSLFYGTILGIFLVAFFVKNVHGRAVFYAAIIAEAVIVTLFVLQKCEVIREIGFLWFNLIAPAIVLLIAFVLQRVHDRRPRPLSA